MEERLPPVRRVVVGNNAAGRSQIVEDGPPRSVQQVPSRPGFQVANLWATFGSPAAIGDPDRTGDLKAISPPAGGTVLRILDFPPEPRDEAEREARMKATFSRFNDAQHGEGKPSHPGMHKTDSIDYAIVLAGEIYALTDEGETLLKPGDVLVHRGTNHAWSNRSDRFCRVAFVLVDAR